MSTRMTQPSNPVSREDFYQAYIIEGLTLEECAKRFNVGLHKIREYRKVYGIERTPEQQHAIYVKAQKQSVIKHEMNGSMMDEELYAVASRERVYDLFISQNLTVADVSKVLGITPNQFCRLKNLYGIKKDQKAARLAGARTLQQEYFEDVEKRISEEDFKQYYVVEDHTMDETIEHFHLTVGLFSHYRVKYRIHKPKEAQVTRCLHSKNLETFEEILSRVDKDTFITDYTGTDLNQPEIEIKYNLSCVNLYKLVEYYSLPRRKCPSCSSSVNDDFGKLLVINGISFTSEHTIYYNLPLRNYYRYDFKIGNTLVEINPTITHTPSINYRGYEDSAPDINYHKTKSETAEKFGFHCIHVWDWDDREKVVASLKDRDDRRYARKCGIEDVDKISCNKFLEMYHLQGTCKGQTIRLGLIQDGELLQVMTFGKPRYNKKAEWELLRLCTRSGVRIDGGAEKLFKYFVDTYSPSSIISYCDRSKFTGSVYTKLGFKLNGVVSPSRHWYNGETGVHITDNLLRQRGFDQLLGKRYGCYGKGTDNEQLMFDHDFLDVYDCGQSTYVWYAE